jgi:hypothetical protein
VPPLEGLRAEPLETCIPALVGIKPSCWSRAPSCYPQRIFEFGFFFVKQLFDLYALRRIGRDGEHRSVMLDVLPNDKTLHDRLQGPTALHCLLELDQCGFWII